METFKITINEKPSITYTVVVEDPLWWHDVTTSHQFDSSDPRKSGDATFDWTISRSQFERAIGRGRDGAASRRDDSWYKKYKDVLEALYLLEFDHVNFHFYDEALYKKTAKAFARKYRGR